MPESPAALTGAHASGDLLLKLYELRREHALRQARHWFFFEFFPKSADDALAAWIGESSAQFRMVTSYWEMAAGLVLHGAIDRPMFYATNTEHVAIIAKLGPFLPELRRRSGLADYLEQVETLVAEMPDAARKLEIMRRFLDGRQTARS